MSLIVHTTAPDIPPTRVEERLHDHWISLLPQGSEFGLWRAFPGQSHEALLQELWTRVRRRPPGKHLFSDLDFIPQKGVIQRIEKDLDTHAAVFVPYFTRDSYGFHKHPFFTALWFWAVNTEDRRLWPPYDWIRTIGRPLDVGAGGFLHLVNSGFCRPEEIKFYDGHACEDTARAGWVDYPALGVHVFNHRNFAEPTKVLEPFGITVAQHVENIERYLARSDS